jgi:uncharacterized protein (TIGR00730 family)
MAIQALAVFCGSKSGNNLLYIEHAKQLGFLLAEKNITLIYGGGNKGLMGAVANAALEKGGKVIGIMPKILAGIEHSHMGLTQMIEVEDMHSRKKMLYEKCDAAIILPGGYGTMDEFFEMLTWNQLNIHNKTLYVLNTDGFYTHLIAFLEKMEEENFLYHKIIDRIIVAESPELLNF